MPMRQYRKLIALFALLAMGLAFLAQISPLWAKDANGTPILICTAFGYETITIDENGNELPTPTSKAKNHCAICLNSSKHAYIPTATLASDTAPQSKIIKLRWSSENTYFTTNSQKSSHAIRAPPKTS